MDAFEEIVAGLFRHGKKKYWTWLNYKIKLTKQEKAEVGKPSMPRPEIDVLAYRPVDNELLWIECKSYLDSPGVRLDHFIGGTGFGGVPKVFVNDKYREIVTHALRQQVVGDGLVQPDPLIRYCLVAGNIFGLSSEKLEGYQNFFEEHGWMLWGPIQIREHIHQLSRLGYENDIAIITAKLLGKT